MWLNETGSADGVSIRYALSHVKNKLLVGTPLNCMLKKLEISTMAFPSQSQSAQMHLIIQIEELESEMHRLRESGEETSAQLELLERGKKKTEAELKEKEAALKLADQRAEERRAELDGVRKVRPGMERA